jgi:CRP-like cAMP-binding protein
MSSKLTIGDLQVIGRVAVFRGLKPATIQHIIKPATVVTLGRHEWIMRQGELATAFFIVIDGRIKLYRSTVSGDEAVIEVMAKGDSFAEAAAFTGSRYIASAETVTAARVVRVPADHLVKCIYENPIIASSMIASISTHMHHLVQQVEHLKVQSGVQRVAEFLVSLALANKDKSAVALPYDKVLIAAQLGLTPESLSRAFARLKGVGVAINAANVVVKDVGKLRQIAADDRGSVRGSLWTMH